MNVCCSDSGDHGIGSKEQSEIATMNDVCDDDDKGNFEHIGVRLFGSFSLAVLIFNLFFSI